MSTHAEKLTQYTLTCDTDSNTAKHWNKFVYKQKSD